MKRIVLIGLLIITGCTVSLIVVSNSEDVEVNKQLETDVDTSIDSLKLNNKTKNKQQ